MRNRFIPLLLLSVFVISSCGTIDITKRRHMPGYHVSVSSKGSQVQPVNETPDARETVAHAAIVAPDLSIRMDSPPPYSLEPVLSASVTASPEPHSATVVTAPSVAPSIQVKEKQPIGRTLRASTLQDEGDGKYGWSVISFISLGLSTVAFITVIVGIALAITTTAFWFVPPLIGLFFGIAGMIMGIIGLRQTRRGGRKGRGFALAGMIAGIVSMVMSIAVLFWVGLILALA